MQDALPPHSLRVADARRKLGGRDGEEVDVHDGLGLGEKGVQRKRLVDAVEVAFRVRLRVGPQGPERQAVKRLLPCERRVQALVGLHRRDEQPQTVRQDEPALLEQAVAKVDHVGDDVLVEERRAQLLVDDDVDAARQGELATAHAMEGDIRDAVLFRHVLSGVDDRPVLDGVDEPCPRLGGEAGEQAGSGPEVDDLVAFAHVLVDCLEVCVHARDRRACRRVWSGRRSIGS